MLIQVIVFVVECGIAGSQFNLSNWCNIEGDLLKDMGAKDPAKIVHDYQVGALVVATPAWFYTRLLQLLCANYTMQMFSFRVGVVQLYRLFSSVMVHSGFLHIMWNLFAQMACCWLFETGESRAVHGPVG